jgi:hypothetical protein
VIDLRDPATWSYLLDDRPFAISLIGPKYFGGLCEDLPLWSNHEEDARAPNLARRAGELSVRWVPSVQRYLLLAMAGPEDPIGAAVIMRTARRPWVSWSRRCQMFDWVNDWMGIRSRTRQFIHNRDAKPPDTVGDCIFPEQCQSGGAAYAPYLMEVRADGERASIIYTLSTWNPYQVMLMKHEVSISELSQLESA